jgi:glycerophosphoryl diester phosphodiesterase
MSRRTVPSPPALASPAAIPRVHPVLDPARRLVFAHRGGAALRPENTLAAFDHGLALGADGLECDVRLSRDGQVVVIHDATVDRTTEATGPVAAFTADELARLDAGYRFGGGAGYPFRGLGLGVPAFGDVLRRYPGVPLIVELKGNSPELARAAVAEARAAGALARICFGSFEDATIRAARAAGADVVTSASRSEIRWMMYGAWLGLPPRRPRFQALQVPEQFGLRRVATRRFVRAARRAGLPVQIWTVDDPAAMERLLAWGVHALITDRPDLAVVVVKRWMQDASPSAPADR